MDTNSLEKKRDDFTRMFKAGLDALIHGDVEGWIAMWADDGKMEFPFAPDGSVAGLGDKAAIRDYMRAYPQTFRLDRTTYLSVHQTLEPDVIIVEFGVEGQAVQTGNPYNQRYVGVVTLRDGLITNYRDYWNPLVLLKALGASEFSDQTNRKEEI